LTQQVFYQSPSIVTAGLGPAIHVLSGGAKTWMRASSSCAGLIRASIFFTRKF
jgi:hypothetical protein